MVYKCFDKKPPIFAGRAKGSGTTRAEITNK